MLNVAPNSSDQQYNKCKMETVHLEGCTTLTERNQQKEKGGLGGRGVYIHV